jgi:organic hydroperoxide reductase OsmC/OhrA
MYFHVTGTVKFMNRHEYKTTLRWTGNLGTGTSTYRAYSRNHEITAPGKATLLQGSSDAHFRGDASRYNPEDLLVASLSACHMLSYLHLCAINNVVVTAYHDDATGTMAGNPDGSGQFTEVVLHPRVTVTPESDTATALHLHEEAGNLCFIARSVNFPVRHEPFISNS